MKAIKFAEGNLALLKLDLYVCYLCFFYLHQFDDYINA